MAATDGRAYLLADILPAIGDDQPDLWKKITRDLLARKDRCDSWRLELDFTSNPPPTDPKFNFKLLLSATGWLRQIHLDLRFATELFAPGEWDPDILEDFVNLAAFTLELFRGKQKAFGKIAAVCSDLPEKEFSEEMPGGRPTTRYESIIDDFRRWLPAVNNDFRLLLKKLGYDQRDKWDAANLRWKLDGQGKISSASFTELLVRNEVQRQQSRIVTRPQEGVQHNTRDAPDPTPVILEILNKLREKYSQILANEGIPTSPGHWQPRMMAIVADADTGIIVTGASQPGVDDSALRSLNLHLAATNICRIRIGEDYASIIHECSRDVDDRVRRIGKNVSENDFGKLHAKFFDKTDEAPSYQKIPFSENAIRCWAFDANFQPRPPCTRCQRIYSAWTLDERPSSPAEWMRGLGRDRSSGTIKYRVSEPLGGFPCTYCAETVAAAKLHLLRSGVLTLFLPKDTDRLKVTDRMVLG